MAIATGTKTGGRNGISASALDVEGKKFNYARVLTSSLNSDSNLLSCLHHVDLYLRLQPLLGTDVWHSLTESH